MKKLLLLCLMVVYSFALTPFSLENIKEVNLKFLNKKEKIPKDIETKVTNAVKSRLESLGIKTTSSIYSNFLIKVDIYKVDKKDFVTCSIFIVEEVIPKRDKSLETIAIVYKKDDSFVAEDLATDIYESVVLYLLDDFIEQYKSEN